jgi:hypothetical protein
VSEGSEGSELDEKLWEETSIWCMAALWGQSYCKCEACRAFFRCYTSQLTSRIHGRY